MSVEAMELNGSSMPLGKRRIDTNSILLNLFNGNVA
jgi:hypothetical protein